MGIIKRILIFIGNTIAISLMIITMAPILSITVILSFLGYIFIGYDPSDILDKGMSLVAWPIILLDNIIES